MLKNPIYTGRVTNKKSEVTDFITGTRKELTEEEWIVVERPEIFRDEKTRYFLSCKGIILMLPLFFIKLSGKLINNMIEFEYKK